MSSVLIKLQKAADKVRAKLQAKGFYEYSGTISPINASNKLAGTREVLGTAVTLPPGIEVSVISETTVSLSSGVLRSGDIKVSGISRLLIDETLVTSLDSVWTLTGPAMAAVKYTLVKGRVKCEDTEWVLTLRPKALQ